MQCNTAFQFTKPSELFIHTSRGFLTRFYVKFASQLSRKQTVQFEATKEHGNSGAMRDFISTLASRAICQRLQVLQSGLAKKLLAVPRHCG
jgi:hypothetical protein